MPLLNSLKQVFFFFFFMNHLIKCTKLNFSIIQLSAMAPKNTLDMNYSTYSPVKSIHCCKHKSVGVMDSKHKIKSLPASHDLACVRACLCMT